MPDSRVQWQDIQDDREKYQAYLCSREWAVLKEAVHQRAGGVCERCKLFPIDAVHHMTYARKYRERPEDLQGHCKHCHAFTHGKRSFDPAGTDRTIACYLKDCRERGRLPVGFCAVEHQDALAPQIRYVIYAIDDLKRFMDRHWTELADIEDVEVGITAMDARLPFQYHGYPQAWFLHQTPERVEAIYGLFGCDYHDRPEWLLPNEG